MRLYKEILRKDWFMALLDFEDHIVIRKRKHLKNMRIEKSWAKKMLINISKAGYFSSDRTITNIMKIFGN